MAQKVQIIPFRKVVAPSTSSFLDYEVPGHATLEKMLVSFMQGQLFAFQVRPVIIKAGTQLPLEVPDYPPNGDKYLTGDNTMMTFECSRPIGAHDLLRVYYNNTDASNSMHLSVDFIIDNYAGKARVI